MQTQKKTTAQVRWL